MTRLDLLLISCTTAAALSCRGQPPQRTEAARGREAHHGDEARPKLSDHHGDEARPKLSDHHSDEARSKLSDLDRTPDALFAATCEHGRKTFECDECRYEVGVVRAARDLFEGGLLETARVERRPVLQPLELTGEVQFDERRVVHLSTQAEGMVRKAHVTLGEKVRKGQPLVELESVLVGEAQAAHLEAQGLLVLARRSFERLSALRREGIASQKEYLSGKHELDAAAIKAEGAIGKLTRLGMASGGARSLTQATATGRLTLRAPIAGTVLDLHAVPGEVVKAEESLMTVGDNATVWVWADVYERDVALITRSQARQPLQASVTVKAYPGEELPGKVDFVSPAMNKISRTVKLRVEVPNRDGRLLAGMFAAVKVLLPSSERALVAPRGAVLEDEGRSFVFVHHHGDYYLRRPVVPGRTFASWTELQKGPPEGTQVVSNGAFLMKSDVLRAKMGAGCAD